MEEAEEAEPDEEFKDAIEVGGLLPVPSPDQARCWVGSELCVLFFSPNIHMEARTCSELEISWLKESHWPFFLLSCVSGAQGRAGSASLSKPLGWRWA